MPHSPYTDTSIDHVLPTLRSAAKITATTSGVLSALVIFAKFSGEADGDDQKPVWADDLFDSNLPGSFSHFYNEMSRGQLQVGGQVLPKRYRSRSSSSAYVAPQPGTPGNYAAFNLEILEQADDDVDMGQFDNDGPDGRPNSGDDDGYVDVVFINLLTVPRDFFIGGATGLASLGLETDFISDDEADGGGRIRVRSRFSGFGGTTQRGHVFTVTAATMCHEFGHVLGLPDLFDQSTVGADFELDPAEDSAGIGKWGLMGLGTLGWGIEDGPNAFSAWSLAKLGWIGRDNAELVRLTQSHVGVEIEQIDVGGRVYRIPVSSDEYFLIENRQSSGSFYNRNIPAGGLLVWHADERADNDHERHKQVDLVCADGLFAERGFPGSVPDPVAGGDNLDFWASDGAYAEDHNGNQGDATDPFDGVRYTRFAADTNPGARVHTGDSRNLRIGFALENIESLSGRRMRADILLRQPLSGHISTDTTWSGPVFIDGDVIVEPGAALTIAAGTLVQVAARSDSRGEGFDSGRVELIVYGDLIVAADPDAPISFESEASSPSRRDWFGVLLMNGQAPELEADLRSGTVSLSHAIHGLARKRLPPGTTEWSGEVRVPWDTVIPSGAELVVDAGTTVRFAPNDLSRRGRDPTFVELTVEGGLAVRGSAAAPVTFTVDSGDRQDAWFGVAMEPGSAVQAQSLVIERAAAAIAGEVSATGSLALQDSRIHGSGFGLRLTVFGEVTIDRSEFEIVTVNALRAEGTGLVKLRNSTIASTGLEGISLGNCSLEAIDTSVSRNGLLDPDLPRSGVTASGGRGQRIELWNCSVAGNTLHGLDLSQWEGRVELHGSDIESNQKLGLLIEGAEVVVFEDSQVERNLGGGVAVTSAPVEVWTTLFDDNLGIGLLLQGSASGVVEMSTFRGGAGLQLRDAGDVIVRRSRFENGSIAFESIDSDPLVELNHFERNLTALKVSGGRVPEDIRANSFVDNSIAIENLSSETLTAQGNFWGTPDSAAIAEQLEGPVEWMPFLEAEPSATAVEEEESDQAPVRFAISSSSPNPFNSATRMTFEVPSRAEVRIEVYDILGRRVRTLVSEVLDPGRFATSWNGRDESGNAAGSGIYIYRMTAGAFTHSGKMSLLR